MKRLAVVTALLMVAACQAREEGCTTSDTGAPAMAPAPADTGMGGMAGGDTMKMGDTTMKHP